MTTRATGAERAPGRAAALPPDERRQRIVDAVVPLLVERGPTVTTREIAEAAGIAEGTLFRVFEDKAALLHEAARSIMDPGRRRSAWSRLDTDLPLAAMVHSVAEHLLENTARVMAVLSALRTTPHKEPGRAGGHGPPAFVLESHQALVEDLTGLFARYRDELTVGPDRAALLMRALVFGSRQPWACGAATLTSEEITAVLISGITRPVMDSPC